MSDRRNGTDGRRGVIVRVRGVGDGEAGLREGVGRSVRRWGRREKRGNDRRRREKTHVALLEVRLTAVRDARNGLTTTVRGVSNRREREERRTGKTHTTFCTSTASAALPCSPLFLDWDLFNPSPANLRFSLPDEGDAETLAIPYESPSDAGVMRPWK